MSQEFAKCPICKSSSKYEQSGIRGSYVKCPKCLAKWKLSIENHRISSLSLHELPKDGSALCKVKGTDARLFTFFGKPLPLTFWKQLKLEERIDWDSLSTLVDASVTDSIMKNKGERVLYRWDGTRTVTTVVIRKGQSFQRKTETCGVLILTTQRLVWLDRRHRGIWNPVTSLVTAYEIPLEDVRGVSSETGDSNNWVSIPKRVSVVDTKGEHRFSLLCAFSEVFKPIIEHAIVKRKAEIETEKKRERVHIMLDFSFLKTFMEKGGLIMQVLKCPECGAPVELPKSGNQMKCIHCGKTIYAQDIFEKVKGLL